MILVLCRMCGAEGRMETVALPLVVFRAITEAQYDSIYNPYDRPLILKLQDGYTLVIPVVSGGHHGILTQFSPNGRFISKNLDGLDFCALPFENGSTEMYLEVERIAYAIEDENAAPGDSEAVWIRDRDGGWDLAEGPYKRSLWLRPAFDQWQGLDILFTKGIVPKDEDSAPTNWSLDVN